GSSLDGGRELVRESAPKQLANSRANSCCRHPHASTSSRDIAARSVRAISFRLVSNRRGTKTVESRSNPSASPNSPLTPSPIPPHATDENGGCERLRRDRGRVTELCLVSPQQHTFFAIHRDMLSIRFHFNDPLLLLV